MYSNPLVSIIIPCYNDAQYIEQSVQSALNQTYPNKEVIVVDDGSNAETKAVLKKLEPKITKLITQENQGVCVARNIGIEEAKGALILVLDSDDYFQPEFLVEACKKIIENEEIALITCWSNAVNTNGDFLFLIQPTGSSKNEVLYFNNSMGSCLFKKEVWRQVGGYDVLMKKGYEDWEFNIAIAKKGYKVHVLQSVLLNYRIKEVSRNTKAVEYQKEIRKYVFDKHRDLAIENYEKTVDFFLNEIEKSKIETVKYKTSNSFKFGHFFYRNVNRIFKLFK
jgi:glycosyltransferase involved in cell wall biosynthesis